METVVWADGAPWGLSSAQPARRGEVPALQLSGQVTTSCGILLPRARRASRGPQGVNECL